jgi:hypothetical protein
MKINLSIPDYNNHFEARFDLGKCSCPFFLCRVQHHWWEHRDNIQFYSGGPRHKQILFAALKLLKTLIAIAQIAEWESMNVFMFALG